MNRDPLKPNVIMLIVLFSFVFSPLCVAYGQTKREVAEKIARALFDGPHQLNQKVDIRVEVITPKGGKGVPKFSKDMQFAIITAMSDSKYQDLFGKVEEMDSKPMYQGQNEEGQNRGFAHNANNKKTVTPIISIVGDWEKIGPRLSIQIQMRTEDKSLCSTVADLNSQGIPEKDLVVENQQNADDFNKKLAIISSQPSRKLIDPFVAPNFNSEANERLVVEPNKTTYYIGDAMSIRVRSTQKCYLNLRYIDVQGQYCRLAPEGKEDVQIDKGKEYEKDDLTVTLPSPLLSGKASTGEERIIATCKSTPWDPEELSKVPFCDYGKPLVLFNEIIVREGQMRSVMGGITAEARIWTVNK